MHRLFPFLALLSICASDDSHFIVPDTWDDFGEELSNYVYQIGTYTVFEWYTDLDYATIFITCDDGDNFTIVMGAEKGVYNYPWKVELPPASVVLESGDTRCMLAVSDYQTYEIFNISHPFLLRSAESFESLASTVVTSYILSTATIVSFTADSTATSFDADSYPSDYPQYDAADDTEKDSSNNMWIGVAAGLGGLWGLTLLSLTGLCFYRSRKQRLKKGQQQPEPEVHAYNPTMAPYHIQNTEPAPPFTPEMTMTRSPPDLKIPLAGRESLTALPSVEGRSTTHNSVISELAG